MTGSPKLPSEVRRVETLSASAVVPRSDFTFDALMEEKQRAWLRKKKKKVGEDAAVLGDALRSARISLVEAL